jgi:ABC-type proline/glycine betaine transport system ATPase subunit
MMNRPKLLLMDEPFSALDSTMRTKLQAKIKTLHNRFGTTTMMVSHDREEALALASRVCILEKGKIIKDGSVASVLLAQAEQKATVLEIDTLTQTRMATVSILGILLKVEVENTVCIGDTIRLTGKKEKQ